MWINIILFIDPKMIKALIFDMDGVIVDSEYHWHKQEYKLLKSLIPYWDKDKHESITGRSVKDIFLLLKKQYTINLTKNEFNIKYDELAKVIYNKRTRLYPGIIAVLNEARKMGLKIGLCSSSSKKWINMVLNRFQLENFFDAIVSSDDISGDSKPSPVIYQYIIGLLNVKSKESIAFEDSENGISSAKNAGLYSVGFRNGFNNNQKLERADMIIEDFNDLNLEILITKFL